MSGSTMSGMEMAREMTEMYFSYAENLGQMMREMMAPWEEMVGSMRESRPRRRHHHHHHKEWHECGHHGHHECWHDSCHCRCCISDADLVVYARLGEVRLVPIEVENNRRREREITLSLSGWSAKGKEASVDARLMSEEAFTLPACSVREVLLGISVKGPEGETDVNEPADNAAAVRQRQVPDVEDCEVFYGNLHVEGCEVRPVRIAVAVLPRDCDPYEIECHCGCC